MGSISSKVVSEKRKLWMWLLPLLLGLTSLSLGRTDIVGAIGLSSEAEVLMTKPWTLLTYTLLHQTPLHLILGVVLLSAIIRLGAVSSRSYWLLFLSGTLAGALSFLAFFPLTGFAQGSLVGSSAGICALVPVTLYRSLFSGERTVLRRTLSLVIATVALIDFVSFFILSSPGFLAHIGGYCVGLPASFLLIAQDRDLLRKENCLRETYSKAFQSGIGALSVTERDMLSKGLQPAATE